MKLKIVVAAALFVLAGIITVQVYTHTQKRDRQCWEGECWETRSMKPTPSFCGIIECKEK
jgi:hypothetical protein